MLRIVTAIVLLVIVIVVGKGAWPHEPINALERSMVAAATLPQNLVPTIFAKGESASEAQKQLIDDGYTLTNTTDVVLILGDRSFGEGFVGDLSSPSPAPGTSAPGKLLQYDKGGSWCRDYRVRLGVTVDGKLQLAQALSAPTCVL